MDKLKIFLVSLLTISFFSVFGQDLSKHRWENRLILIFAKDNNFSKIQDQLSLFRKVEKGIDERKLLVYSILPDRYQLSNVTEGEWIRSEDFSRRYKSSSSTFEIVLIGLDGGVKLRQFNLLFPEKLFALIDGMPMRRAEIRKSKTRF